jgi:uncharacterized membrane protein YgdD (TMEM256/DUF423 family)
MAALRLSGWVKLGAYLAGLAVACGAVAAHGIDRYLAERYAGQTRELVGETMPAARKYLDDFKTASRYQMYHALGLIAIGVVASSYGPNRRLSAAAWCHLAGIVMFCGSLYVLALTAHSLNSSTRHALGLTAATGGTLFIVGWCLFAAGACGCRTTPINDESSR